MLKFQITQTPVSKINRKYVQKQKNTNQQQKQKKTLFNQPKKTMDKNIQKLKYQTSVHHRQNLRNNLDQNMIDQLQISNTPSLNYQKAYQSLYYDELQKSVHLHDKKKNMEEIKKVYDQLVSKEHGNLYRQGVCQPLKNSVSPINIPNLNYRDVDYMNYDLLKQTKALDHTLKNYDGGQGFYRNCDYHLLNQKIQQQNMRKTLLSQINQKQQSKQNTTLKKHEQQSALKNRQQAEHQYRHQIQNSLLQQKIKHRDQIVNQIQEQRIKRGRRSIFNYNNVARHNPITNPIQYHIDNPYILKQMQNQYR